MKKIVYEVHFLDYWHIGSGQSAGALSDAVVLRDFDGLPYIPGKTVKGLVREIAESVDDNEFVEEVLGKEGETYSQKKTYFSNVHLKERQLLRKSELKEYLFEMLTFTALEPDKKVAKDRSLRDVEMVVPIVLEGIVECDGDFADRMRRYLLSIKRMGLMRNRGFGRCMIELKDES